VRSIKPIEEELNVPRLCAVPREVPTGLPCELRNIVDLVAGIVADGFTGPVQSGDAKIRYVCRAKVGGQFDPGEVEEQARAASEAVREAAEKQVEEAVLDTDEFRLAADLGAQLDQAREDHSHAKRKLEDARAARQSAIDAGQDPRGFRPAIRDAEDDAADLAALVGNIEAKYNAASAAVTALRKKHTLFAGVRPLQDCRDRRQALQSRCDAFLREAAADLFSITMIEAIFAPSAK